MSEKTFTPGPWQTMPEEHDKQYVRIRGTQLGERYKIANVLAPDYEGANELEADETRANARLIAAAPELLEALRDMLSGWKYIREVHGDLYGVGWDRAQEKAESAIAKATGAA
jgi:hypothetical protein